MRTNIEIDDDIMQAAMNGSAFKTKREAVEAGLKLLARQQHNREVLKWEGKLHWDDSPASIASFSNTVMESRSSYGAMKVSAAVKPADGASSRRGQARTAKKAKA